jgi:hypothetical protein
MDILKCNGKAINILSRVSAHTAGEDEKEGPQPFASPKKGVLTHLPDKGDGAVKGELYFLVDPV